MYDFSQSAKRSALIRQSLHCQPCRACVNTMPGLRCFEACAVWEMVNSGSAGGLVCVSRHHHLHRATPHREALWVNESTSEAMANAGISIGVAVGAVWAGGVVIDRLPSIKRLSCRACQVGVAQVGALQDGVSQVGGCHIIV